MWKVKISGGLTINSALSVPGLISSAMVGNEGQLSLSVFNSTEDVLCLPARATGIRIFGAKHYEVKKLPNVSVITMGSQGKVGIAVRTVLGTTEEEIRSSLVAQFPEVFDLTRHPITPAMKALTVKESELPRQSQKLVGGRQTTYNVDKSIRHDDIIAMLEHLERMGYVERIAPNTPVFLSPFMPIPKSSDPSKIRIVNDFRLLNGYYPTKGRSQIDVRRVISQIPKVWKYYSVLDLKEGFYSVPIEASLKPLFAFQYRHTRWQFKRLPQGFSFSPILFSERVSYLLEGTGALSFMDDIIIGGQTPEEHHAQLFRVMKRLQKFGLKLNSVKMKLFRTEVVFLRYTLRNGEWSLQPYLDQKFSELGEVRSRKCLERHVGILSFARTHIPFVEQALKPLRALLQKSKTIEFTTEAWKMVTTAVRTAYEQSLNLQVPLTLFNECFSQFSLYTDWTDYHLGYMLFGKETHSSCERLLDVGSKMLAMTTSSYLGELKGVEYALRQTKAIRGFVSTTLYSDNRAAVDKLRSGEFSDCDIRVRRVWEYLAHNESSTKYEFLPSSENGGADGLSRLNVAARRSNRLPAEAPLVRALTECSRPSDEEIHRRISLAHSGHWSVEVTLQNALMEFGKWPSMREDVTNFVNACPNCAYSGHGQIRDLPQTDFAHEVGERVHIDYAGPYFDRSHVLVIIDAATRYVFTLRTSGTGARHAMKALDEWMQRLGPIKVLCADNASAWNSVDFQAWAQRRGIQLRLSPSYYHQANGLAERVIQTLLHRMRRMLNGSRRGWPNVIQRATSELNRSWHSAIGTCPQALALGLSRKGELLSDSSRTELWKNAWSRQEIWKEKERDRFEWKHPRRSQPLQIGGKVLLKDSHYNTRPLRKLSPTWTGPYYLYRRLSQSTWLISTHPNGRRTKVAHSSQLKPYLV